MFQHVRCFAENQTAVPLIRTMARINCWYPRHISYYGMMQAAKQRAAQTVAEIRAMPEGERVVFLWWLLTYELAFNRGADPAAIVEKGGVNVNRAIAFLEPFSRELKRQKVPIDLCYMDHENGIDYFEIGGEGVRRIFASARARKKLPAWVRNINLDNLRPDAPRLQEDATIWNRYAMQVKYDAIRRVVIESGLFDVISESTGRVQTPAAINFWAVKPTFPIYDYHGWLQYDTSIDGYSSGPSCYMADFGNAYRRRMHDRLWNHLVNTVNHIRSCMGAPGYRVNPVINNPDAVHPWLYEQVIAHAVRTGVNWTRNKCAFCYWNAVNPTDNDPVVAEILGRHDLDYTAARDLPEIPFDVDEIRTRDYVTTYADFLVNLDEVINDPDRAP